MSALSYNIGFTLGTVTRGIILGTQGRSASEPTQFVTEKDSDLPGPCLPDQLVEDLSQTPAFVRASGVDLYSWYTANTRPVSKPVRKRRSTKKKVEAPASEALPIRSQPYATGIPLSSSGMLSMYHWRCQPHDQAVTILKTAMRFTALITVDRQGRL